MIRWGRRAGSQKLLQASKNDGSSVLAMSHLGYYPMRKHGEVGDTQVAAQAEGIDFIASEITRTFMEKPVLAKEPRGQRYDHIKWPQRHLCRSCRFHGA